MKRLTGVFVIILIGFVSFSSGAQEMQLDDEIMIGPLSGRTPYVQRDILRIHPDDNAAFVAMRVPHPGQEPDVEVLSVDGKWERVRLHYRFIFNSSRDPSVCARSLFDQEFIGYRRVIEK